MKQHIKLFSIIALSIAAASCDSYLEEHPKTFLTPDNYYNTEAQMEAAVNGIYTYNDDLFNGDVQPGSQRIVFLDYMAGYGRRPNAATTQALNQALTQSLTPENTYMEGFWQTCYFAIENANTTIAGIEGSTADVSQETKNTFLGEAYFLRAYYYFDLVRIFGPVPLKVEKTSDLNNVQLPLASIEEIYTQIESDLQKSEELMANTAWSRADGHVSKGAVKAFMARVYLTMAGYPLQKGTEYYQKAYEKAKEVVASNAFYLFDNYAALRDKANENSGEFIFSIQCEADYASSPMHTMMLPYPKPEKAISANADYGGALAPTTEFYNSFSDDDARKTAYFYSSYPAQDGSGEEDLGGVFIYKFWDEDCATSGKSGINFGLIKYSDVLLTLAEAKASADGGTTSDPDAINAWYEVHHRAYASDPKPTSLTFDTVYKERLWELCFEGQNWFDMLRTRRAVNPITGNVVNLIGYTTPAHLAPFTESSLLCPYPVRETRLNPNLTR